MSKPVVLKVFKNGGVVDVKQFVGDQAITLGSSAGDTQVTLEGSVSPIHASIEKRGDKYFVCDLGSSQGTFLKGAKVLEAPLEHGDKIAIGEYIIEFYVGAPVASATSAVAPTTPSEPTTKEQSTSFSSKVVSTTVSDPDNFDDEPTAVIEQPVSSGGVDTYQVGSGESMRLKKTFAPPSSYKNLMEFIKPTKGSTIEVLVAWRERVINAYHFNNKGTIYYGNHPGNDVVVPSLSSKVVKAPLLQIDGQATVFIPNGLDGVLVYENTSTKLSELYNQGRIQSQKGSSTVNLSQGEMIRLNMGGDVEIVVRYCSETPKPVFIPFIDFTSNGFLAVLLSVILAVIVSLYVALNKVDEMEKEEEEYRTALIIDNPPKPPPQPPSPKMEVPEVEPKKMPPIKKKVVVKPKESKSPTMDIKKKQARKKVSQKKRRAQKAGGGNQQKAKSMRANPNKKKSSQVGSVKKGGAVKTGNKQGAQAKSETKDPSKSGIFGVFGTAGKQKTLDNTYSGSGELAGLADQATGRQGWNEDRAGEGLGSKFKETGGGQGKSNVGVSGMSSGKGLGMGTGGFGGVGLGGKGTVTIVPGGSGEEYGGNIDRNGIRQVFIRNQRVLQACYERALVSDKGLGGKVMLDFEIGERGRVLSASVSRGKSTLYNAGLNNCIVNRLKGWRFPEPPEGVAVQVFYPLAFANN